MTHTQIIIGFIVLLAIGLSLSANNVIHSLVVNLFLYNDPLTNKFTRIMGVILILSSILFIVGAYDICMIVISFVLIVFIFLIIRSRNKSRDEKEKRKQELIKMHLSEVDEKMQKIQQLREKLETNQTTKTTRSISNIKRSRWDDGRPTNKEIIEEFKK